MKIIIIGANKADETVLLKKEAERRGWQVELANLSQLVFVAEKSPKIYKDQKNLSDGLDAIIIRGMTKHPNENLILAEFLGKRGVRVVDNRLAIKRYITTKLATSYKLSHQNINHPKTIYSTSNKNLDDIVKNLGFPMIVKDIVGKHSKGVYRFVNKQELDTFFQRSKAMDFIFQEDLKTDVYYRVFTIGFKAIGAIKRVKTTSLTHSGSTSGVRSKKIKPSREMIEIAEKTAKITDNEICGLDIIKKDGKYYIIEANRAPQFKAFSEKTGINVAKKILDYVQKTLRVPPQLS